MSEAHVTVRLFAAAAEAAGTQETLLWLRPGASNLDVFIQELPARLAEQGRGGPSVDEPSASGSDAGPELSRVCRYSSFLINGVRARPEAAVLRAGDTLDVLPPFAGG